MVFSAGTTPPACVRACVRVRVCVRDDEEEEVNVSRGIRVTCAVSPNRRVAVCRRRVSSSCRRVIHVLARARASERHGTTQDDTGRRGTRIARDRHVHHAHRERTRGDGDAHDDDQDDQDDEAERGDEDVIDGAQDDDGKGTDAFDDDDDDDDASEGG